MTAREALGRPVTWDELLTYERALSARQVAGATGMSEGTVRAMARKGLLPGYRCGIGSRRQEWRFRGPEVRAALGRAA